MQDTQDLILTELRQLRSDFIDFAMRVESRIAALEADNHALMGNGQPGRMTEAEEDIEELQHWRWWLLGAAGGASALFSAIGWIIVHLLPILPL